MIVEQCQKAGILCSPDECFAYLHHFPEKYVQRSLFEWKLIMNFCQLGIYRKNLLFIPKNTGILSDFSLIMGIADPFLLYIPKTQENQGVLWVYCCSFFAICPICDISISYDVRCTLPVIMLWKTIEPQYYNGGSMNMNIKRNFLHWIIYDRHTLSEQRCRFRNHQRRDPLSEIIWI